MCYDFMAPSCNLLGVDVLHIIHLKHINTDLKGVQLFWGFKRKIEMKAIKNNPLHTAEVKFKHKFMFPFSKFWQS